MHRTRLLEPPQPRRRPRLNAIAAATRVAPRLEQPTYARRHVSTWAGEEELGAEGALKDPTAAGQPREQEREALRLRVREGGGAEIASSAAAPRLRVREGGGATVGSRRGVAVPPQARPLAEECCARRLDVDRPEHRQS